MHRLVSRAAILGICWLASAASPALADVLDPEDFASLGTLAWSSGSYTINTDLLTIVDNAAPGTPLFSGVVDDQNGAADSFGGNPGPLGIPEIAVFTFASIAIDGTANVTIVGTRALALLSRGDALIDRVLAVDGKGVWAATSTTFLAGGPGGFGGGINGQGGLGPGGGAGWTSNNNSVCSTGGGFGSAGLAGAQMTSCLPAGWGPPTPGSTYGDLQGVLQGGSGGGSAYCTYISGIAAGAGGGGAIEIGAVGSLTVGASGTVRANGGEGQLLAFAVYEERSAGGSGGAIRLAAGSLSILGNVQARGGRAIHGGNRASGGGGRVLLRGLLGLFVAGTTTLPSALTTGINVSSLAPAGSQGYPVNHGWISVEPRLTFVEAGDSLDLSGFVLQAPSDLQPGVELVSRNVIAQGNLSVPSGGLTYEGRIQLDRITSSITGTGTLTLAGSLTGTGSVAVPVVNTPLGGVLVFANALAFGATLTNQAGAAVTVVDGLVSFPGDGLANDDGLVNLGTLNLTDAFVDGDVRTPAGSTVNIAGDATFNGFVSGAGTFSGTTNQVTFNGGYSPGDSPAAIAFGGDVAFGAGNVLALEIGGTAPGTQHDQVNVAGTLATGGALALLPAGAFAPAQGDTFAVLTYGSRNGEFAIVSGVQQPGGLDLALRYDASAAVVRAVKRGDVNADGLVTAADQAIIAANLGLTTTAYGAGDVDGNGSVGATDQQIVADAIAGALPVPVLGPWGSALLCAGLAALGARSLLGREAAAQ